VTGFTSSVEGLTFNGVTASGSGTNTGTYDVTFTGVTLNTTKDESGNYVVTETTNGTLTITAKTVSDDSALKVTQDQNGFYATFTGSANDAVNIPDAICVEYEKLSMEMVHHENLYLGLSDEADKAITEIDDEETALADREEIREWERQQRMQQTSISSANAS